MAALLGTPAVQAISPAEKCEATKLGVAGKYLACRLKAEAAAAKSAQAPDFSKCDPTLSLKWTQAEIKAGGACPSNGDEAAVQAFIAEHTDALSGLLNGATSPAVGVLSCNADLLTCDADVSTCAAAAATCSGELASCGASLASSLATNCAIRKVLKTGQTNSFGVGSDGDLEKGAARSYTDNGDGTITDNTTGLMWEKKSQDGSIHSMWNVYTWSGPSLGTTQGMNGTVASEFLATLNGGGGFAGYTDWRIPNRFELDSLLNLANKGPAVDSAFNSGCEANCTVLTCSCTQSWFHWSSTTLAGTPFAAWAVDFSTSGRMYEVKSSARVVRAVRSGS
jgi:hypothetical protein